MLEKAKTFTGYQWVANYLAKTSIKRKIVDTLLLCLILIVWGYASGKITTPLINIKPHTVEASLDKVRQVQKVLDVYQVTNQYSFVGHYIFHNGQASLNGSFSFIKYSLMEYSSNYGVRVNPMEWKDVPIQMSIPMITAFQERKCYTKVVGYDDVQLIHYREMNVDEIITCPIFDRKGNLASFVMVGANRNKLVDQSAVELLAKEVSVLQ